MNFYHGKCILPTTAEVQKARQMVMEFASANTANSC